MQRLILLGIAFGITIGCTGTGDTKPTAPTTVEVTYKGSPVEGAIVTLAIADNPPPAFGTTDAQGKAILTTYKQGDGALIGNHVVTIMKQKFGKNKGPDQGNQDEGDYLPSPGATPPPVVENLLPVKYSLPGSSGLNAEVKSGKNEFKFDLK